MNNRFQSFAPYAGILGAALIVLAFFLELIVASIPIAVVLGLGAIGIVLIAVALLFRPREELREMFTGRRTAYGTNAVIVSIAFVGIVALIYLIGSQQLSHRFDLTQNQSQTLSDQTVKVLEGLKDPIKVTGFFAMPNYAQNQSDAQKELDLFKKYTNKIDYQFVDPQANPVAAEGLKVTAPYTVVFEQGTRNEKVTTYDESAFTNAILKVTQTQQPAIYFTTGHGEIDPQDSSQAGLSAVTSYLQQVNYKVDKLNLATGITETNTITGGLPADTSAIVVADPTKAFEAQDVQRLKQYVAAGGRILIMLDPGHDAGLQDLLSAWGLQYNNDIVLDPAPDHNLRGQPIYPIFTSFPSHPITENLSQYGVVLPAPRSIKTVQGSTQTPTALFTTSDQACGKTDIASLQSQTTIQCDPSKDEKGPFVLGYSVEGTAQNGSDKTPRLVVLGNSQFASNQVVQQAPGNSLLVENIVNWLAGQEQLISIPPKPASQHPLNVTTQTDAMFIMVSDVVLIPLAIFLLGFMIWWRRR